MEQVIIRNLGVGALLIEADQKRLLVDAFNDLVPPVAVLPDDILLFTHDDGDHFSADRLPLIKGANVTVVGPPTIVKPIMIADKADVAQIQVLYSNQYMEPAVFEQGDNRITCYATRHFNHWDPIHNSYLLEIGGRKIFILECLRTALYRRCSRM